MALLRDSGLLSGSRYPKHARWTVTR